MKLLGVIPARGGSRGIPDKNLVPLRGRPLIAYTCDAALGSEKLDRVIVSTDSDRIAAAAEACGVDVPFRRPAEIAGDDTPMLPVLQHAFRWSAAARFEAEALVLLQPTSPLRTARHVDEAITIFERERPSTLVSVVALPHNFHPVSVMVEDGGLLRPYLDEEALVLRRQDKPLAYARNGPAILIVSTPTLLHSETLYGERVLKYEMSPAASLDVDDREDLEEAGRRLDRLACGGAGPIPT